MTSTSTSSESLAWVIRKIIWGKYDLPFQIELELMTGQTSESSREEKFFSINL